MPVSPDGSEVPVGEELSDVEPSTPQAPMIATHATVTARAHLPTTWSTYPEQLRPLGLNALVTPPGSVSAKVLLFRDRVALPGGS
jgi:hypothetical protein